MVTHFAKKFTSGKKHQQNLIFTPVCGWYYFCNCVAKTRQCAGHACKAGLHRFGIHILCKIGQLKNAKNMYEVGDYKKSSVPTAPKEREFNLTLPLAHRLKP
jgi:hypothetical protein